VTSLRAMCSQIRYIGVKSAVALSLELHLHCHLHGYWASVLLGGFEFPFPDGFDGGLFEGLLVTAQHPHRLHASFRIDSHEHHDSAVPLRIHRQIRKLRIGGVGRLGRFYARGDALKTGESLVIRKIGR